MKFEDKAYLISKNKYNENSSIAEFYTENNGKITGIIFGSSSKKIKNYLTIGNKFYVKYLSKSETKIGNFKVEIDEILTPFFLENNKKLLCIIACMNLIKILTVDGQHNKHIFNLIGNLFKILHNKEWIKDYIFWELEFFKIIGYDLNLKNIVSKEIINGKIIYFVESQTEKKIVPNFLIDKNYQTDKSDIFKGLKLVGDYLDKSILKPNNIIYPNARFDFINLFK